MWKWSCPKTTNLIFEFHSWSSLDQSLTAHKDGMEIPGFTTVPGCEEIHDFWDDGEPCSVRNCKIPYIRESSSERR